jgi:signal transduction histidine kinase
VSLAPTQQSLPNLLPPGAGVAGVTPGSAVASEPAIVSELAARLAWLVRLRWGAAATLILASLLTPAIGVGWQASHLFLLGVTVAAYNAVFLLMLRGSRAVDADLRVSAIAQICLDLAALLIAVHLTGGLASPILLFFGFHMAIGTMLVAAETMYLLAALTSLSAVGIRFLESSGVIERFPHEAWLLSPGTVSALALLAFVGFLFGVVYLTSSVSNRLKQRNVELARTTDVLRRQSAELQRLLAEMAELEHRKSHYMRISAHQLRSPLGTVRTSLDVLAGGYVDLSSERAKRLICGAADRVNGLLNIVNGLLDLAKVREGRQRAVWMRHVNVNQFLADLFDSLAPYAEERKVRLVPDFNGVAVLDWGVPPDLVHAFENLLHNALKYSQPGGEVIVRLRLVGEHAVVRVEDQGIGVPPEFRDHLFLEFVRAPNARSHAPEGTGLGLALVREVAIAHGGRAVLEEREAPGATFRVELPLHRVPPELLRPLQGGYAHSYAGDTEEPPPGHA